MANWVLQHPCVCFYVFSDRQSKTTFFYSFRIFISSYLAQTANTRVKNANIWARISNGQNYCMHRLIKYVDAKGNAKCRHLKNWPVRGFAAVVYLSEAPPLLGFCLGWSSNFVENASGQIKSVKLLQNMVSNRTQHPPPPPNHTLSVYSVLWHREGGRGGGLNQRESWRGNSSQSWVENTNMTDCISSL